MVEMADRMLADVEILRSEFPTLQREVYGKPLVYLDNGATAQKPQSVIDCISHYYTLENANIHRGVHHLSQVATDKYEAARQKIANWINAPENETVIFTKGTTDGINLIAHSYGEQIQAGDEILITGMEHHSNIVPWQMLCERKNAVLRVIEVEDDGSINFENFLKLFSDKTKIVSITHISNTLGTINPIDRISEIVRPTDAILVVDGAQAVPHMRVDVQTLDCDFYVFSGHKMFGPTGVGILYGKKELLNQMPPYQGGGDMIAKVTFEKTTYNELPHKFEAGTPHIAGGIALGAAVDFLSSIDLNWWYQHEQDLLNYGTELLNDIEGVQIIGTASNKASVISFVVDGLHPFDIGTLLDKQGIAVRTGHHCTQPLMDRFGIPGTVRASFAMYNTKKDIDQFIFALKRSINMLK